MLCQHLSSAQQSWGEGAGREQMNWAWVKGIQRKSSQGAGEGKASQQESEPGMGGGRPERWSLLSPCPQSSSKGIVTVRRWA